MPSTYKHKSSSDLVLTQLMLPTHTNFGGKIHGGHILNLMDQVAYACASKFSESYCVTASVNTVNFRAPVEVGELLTLKASINYVGNSSMVVGIRVEAENPRKPSHPIKHCNSSYFTMVALDENGNKVDVPGLVLENEDDIRRFSKSIARQKAERAREEEFADRDFTTSKYRELLKDYKVRMEM